MTDARRSRWIAFDASFYDDRLGVMIRERFGPVGLTLFSAFLCACKRSSIQGRISYGSDSDCMAQLGLAGMELVNEEGEPFDLETFWTALGDHRQTTRRRRGRLTDVTSTRWAKWQENFARQQEAERKGRSRATNTPDDPPPEPSGYPAEKTPDLDCDFDPDIDSSSSAIDAATSPSPDTLEEEGFRIREAAELIAAVKGERRRKNRKLMQDDPVNDWAAWLNKAAERELPTLRALAPVHPDADSHELAELVIGKDKPPAPNPEPRPPSLDRFDDQPEPAYDLDENNEAVRIAR